MSGEGGPKGIDASVLASIEKQHQDSSQSSAATGLSGNIGMGGGIGVGDRGMSYGIGGIIDPGMGGKLSDVFSFLKEGALERNFINDAADGTALAPGNIAISGMNEFIGLGNTSFSGVSPGATFNAPPGLPGLMGPQKGGVAPAA